MQEKTSLVMLEKTHAFLPEELAGEVCFLAGQHLSSGEDMSALARGDMSSLPRKDTSSHADENTSALAREDMSLLREKPCLLLLTNVLLQETFLGLH